MHFKHTITHTHIHTRKHTHAQNTQTHTHTRKPTHARRTPSAHAAVPLCCLSAAPVTSAGGCGAAHADHLPAPLCAELHAVGAVPRGDAALLCARGNHR